MTENNNTSPMEVDPMPATESGTLVGMFVSLYEDDWELHCIGRIVATRGQEVFVRWLHRDRSDWGNPFSPRFEDCPEVAGWELKAHDYGFETDGGNPVRVLADDLSAVVAYGNEMLESLEAKDRAEVARREAEAQQAASLSQGAKP